MKGEAHHTTLFSFYSQSETETTVPHAVTVRLIFNAEDKQLEFTPQLNK